jgi:hypothetical protein
VGRGKSGGGKVAESMGEDVAVQHSKEEDGELCALCMLKDCVKDGKKKRTEWIGCDCDRWYHKTCTGLYKFNNFSCSQVLFQLYLSDRPYKGICDSKKGEASEEQMERKQRKDSKKKEASEEKMEGEEKKGVGKDYSKHSRSSPTAKLDDVVDVYVSTDDQEGADSSDDDTIKKMKLSIEKRRREREDKVKQEERVKKVREKEKPELGTKKRKHSDERSRSKKVKVASAE